MTYQFIKEERVKTTQIITINRPDKLNALNKVTIQELHQALSIVRDDSEIRTVILTGAGPKAFVAGADISEFANFSSEQGEALAREGQQKLFDYIANFPKPIIAAVNGYALGGGLELALAAHIRIASENARFGLPEVTLGLIPGYGGTQRLPELIGKGRAIEMIVTADMIDSQRALSYGLVNSVVSQDELLNMARKMAETMGSRSPKAITAALRAIHAGYSHKDSGYTAEIENFGHCFATEDFREGTQAFLEKRKPEFLGK